MADAAAYQLRHPRAEDVDALAEVHCRVWQQAYRGLMEDRVVDALTPEQFRPGWQRWAQGYAGPAAAPSDRACVVALADGAPVAFLAHGAPRDEHPPAPHQLWALNVLPEHQGTGLAQRLMDEVFGNRAAYLWVARGNDRAIRFYERNGFVLDGTQATDQHDGVTELRMVRPR